MHAKKIADAVLLYVFNIGFSASLLKQISPVWLPFRPERPDPNLDFNSWFVKLRSRSLGHGAGFARCLIHRSLRDLLDICKRTLSNVRAVLEISIVATVGFVLQTFGLMLLTWV